MPKKKHVLLLGAHMSIAGGLEKSILRAESIDCTCMQIFTKSNRQWRARPLNKEEINLFKQTAQQSPLIKAIVAHTSYLINIASPQKDIEKKSVTALTEELKRCEALAIPYLVLHPGAYLSGTLEEGIEQIADNLNTILQKVPGKTTILLENTAGQGTMIGATFEQLAAIYQKVKKKSRIGFCIDTCHTFVAGYDFRTKKTYEKLCQTLDAVLGLKNIKAIHLNDSKKPLGSRVDRHEAIGKGLIGLNGFRLLFNDERFFDIPKILETPKEDLADDQKNMATIKKLISPATRRKLTILG